MTSLIKEDFIEAKKCLEEFVNDNKNLDKIEQAGIIMTEAIKKGHKIISCGNGGSMCDAMHFAEELTGRFRGDRRPIAALSASDASHITCTANDYGFNSIFSRYVEGIGNEGDVLLAISTSGNSENVVMAAHTAKQIGMKIVALTGKDGGKLATLCNIEIRAPFFKYSDRVQEIHIKVIHSLIHFIETNLNV